METKTSDLIKNDSRVGVGKYIMYLLRCWWAILIVMVIFGALGYLYASIKSEKYEIKSSIIMNDSDNDGKGTLSGTGLGSLFSSFTMGGASFKLVEDEIRRIQSHDNLIRVTSQLGINSTSWSKPGGLNPKVWYYKNEPIIVSLKQGVIDTLSVATKFQIDVAEGAKDIRVRAEQPAGKEVLDKTYSKFPIVAKTPYATFYIDKSPTYNPTEPLHFYNITMPIAAYADKLYKRLDLGTPTKKSNIIYVTMEDNVSERGIDIVNTLVEVYNKDAIDTQHEEALAAINFINERMGVLYSQLQDSERNIENFKRENKVSDPEIDAKYALQMKGDAESALIEQRTKAGVTRMIIDFLRNDGSRYSMIPFTSDAPEAPIQAYNDLVMERMRLEQNAKGNNSTLRGLTAQIDAMRANLISSLERDLSATNIAVSDLQRVNSESDSRIGQVPMIERKLTELYRNQTIQSQIYGFMLQKLEENQLKLAREIPAGRVMEKAYTPSDSGGPGKKLLIIIFAFLGGCLAVGGLSLVFWYQGRRDKMAEVEPIAERV